MGTVLTLRIRTAFFVIDAHSMAIALGDSKAQIIRWRGELLKKGAIKAIDTDMEKYLRNKNLSGFGVGNKKCAWCGIRTAVLDRHHYPVPKRLGGKQIVEVCPNCHREFHAFKQKYKLNLPPEKMNILFTANRGLEAKNG